jgi:hypothetical protein
MNIVRVISNEVSNLFRKIKVRRQGNTDVQTPSQAAPFGIDSVPIPGMSAIYAETGKKGKAVVIGYLNKSLLAQDGETRIYSVDEDGALKTFIWLKADGTIEIGGSAKNMVRYQELESAFNTLKTDFNDLVSKFNTHVHSGVSTGGGSSGVPSVTDSASTADITGAKIEEIKTL